MRTDDYGFNTYVANTQIGALIVVSTKNCPETSRRMENPKLVPQGVKLARLILRICRQFRDVGFPP
jgi:hypothetical protein